MADAKDLAVGGGIAAVLALALLPLAAGGYIGYRVAGRKAWGALAGVGVAILVSRAF